MSLWNKIKIIGALGLLTVASYGCKVAADLDAKAKAEINYQSKNTINNYGKKTEEEQTKKESSNSDKESTPQNPWGDTEKSTEEESSSNSDKESTPQYPFGDTEKNADKALRELDEATNPNPPKVTPPPPIKDPDTVSFINTSLEQLVNTITRSESGYSFFFKIGEPKEYFDVDNITEIKDDYSYFQLIIPNENDSIKIYRTRITNKEGVKEERGLKISSIDQNKFLKAIKEKYTPTTKAFDNYDYTKTKDIVKMLDLNLFHDKISSIEKNKKDAEDLIEIIKNNLDELITSVTKWEKAPEIKKNQFSRILRGYKLKIDNYKAIIPADNLGNIYFINDEATFLIKFSDLQEYLDSKEIKKNWIKPVGPHVSLDRSDKDSLHLVDVLDNILLNFYTNHSQKDLEKGYNILRELEKGIKKYINRTEGLEENSRISTKQKTNLTMNDETLKYFARTEYSFSKVRRLFKAVENKIDSKKFPKFAYAYALKELIEKQYSKKGLVKQDVLKTVLEKFKALNSDPNKTIDYFMKEFKNKS